MITSTEDAARAIADAVLDDDAPLRVGCDPLGIGLIDAWRTTPDEDLMQAMMSAWIDPLTSGGHSGSHMPPQGPEPCHW